MNDPDQTILSSRGAVHAPGTSQSGDGPKRNPLLIIGGIGCALLLFVGLLIGGGYYFAGDQIRSLAGLSDEEESATTEAPTQEPAVTTTPTPEETEASTATPDTSSEETETSDEQPENAQQEDTSASSEPAIGEITFALGATDEYEPIDPADTFEEGITEVHAIFEYSGLSTDNTWERVWYLDGNEMLRSSEAWAGDKAGIFDYFINAGGEPLTPGEWVLELYVEGNLLATGNFTIEPTAEAIAEEDSELVQESTDTAEHAADIATATPTPTATSAPAPPPAAKTYKLVYTKWDGGRHNIYINDTNGSTEQFILNNGAGPSWSTDGASIFFFGEPGVNQQNRDAFPGVGSCELPGVSDGLVQISIPPAPYDVCQGESEVFQGSGWNDGTARWTSVSPDGNMVAFDAKPGGGYRIYFLGTADNQQFHFEIIGEQADWSPDSQKIVYRSGRDGQFGIWISNRDDTGHTLITNNGSDSFPAWSPDGSTIAFSREVEGNVDIYTMNVDGSNIQRITDAPGPDSLPTYTPSGEIIFRSARSGSWGIWKMRGDGSNQQEIIPDAGVGPDWAYSKMDVLP